jgi:hypothetical protein
MLEMAAAATGATMIDPLITLLVGAFGAALLGLLGAWIASKRDHRKWIREQRFSAYVEYLLVAQQIASLNGPDDADDHERVDTNQLSDGLQNASATLQLLGPDEVVAAVLRHSIACNRYMAVLTEASTSLFELRSEADQDGRGEDEVSISPKLHDKVERRYEALMASHRKVIVKARKHLRIHEPRVWPWAAQEKSTKTTGAPAPEKV